MSIDLSTGGREAHRPDRPRQRRPSRAAARQRLLRADASPDLLSDDALAAHSQAYIQALDVFKNIIQQYNPEEGQLMLRFEHFKFVPMPMKQWNRSIVTPMRLVHTLTPEPDSRMKKNKDFKQRLRQCLCATALD